MATERKPLMIRGDRLLLALNVLEVGRWPLENFRSHPEWFGEENVRGLDVEKTQGVLRRVFGHKNPLRYADLLCRKLYPLLAASAAGVAGAEFSIEAIVDNFLSPDHRKTGWTEDPGRLRTFLARFAAGELTEADFKN